MKVATLALFLACLVPVYAHAQLVITKVMSNPVGSNAGRQWVEINNTGTTSIDLGSKNIRFYTTSGNHLIKGYAGGTTILAPGSSGVIAENPMSFLFDYPSYTGILFKSSFTLPAAGLVGIVQTDGTVLVKKPYVAVVTPSTAKPASASKSTTKRATRTASGTSKSTLKATKTSSYGKGTLAPAASADAEAAGAVFTLPALLAPAEPYLASVWFSVFLALIAFSGFSLIVIQRHYYV